MGTLSELVEALFSSSHKPDKLEQLHKEILANEQIDIARHRLRSFGLENKNDIIKTPWASLTNDWSKLPTAPELGGLTLLYIAVFLDHERACEWLLQQGATVYPQEEAHLSPLHWASLCNSVNVLKCLRFYHADIYYEAVYGDDGQAKTPLSLASSDEVKEVLLSSRFASEEVEEEFLQEKLPELLEVVVSINAAETERIRGLYCLRSEMRSATSSMTSVPKPLKIMIPHFENLKNAYKTLPTGSLSARLMGDVLSILSMTIEEDSDRQCLNYQLVGSKEQIGSFGHPYIRHLCAQMPVEFAAAEAGSGKQTQLMELVKELIKYCLDHHAEAEACDLLMEIEHVELLLDYVTEDNHSRVCLYLSSCVKYVPEPEDSILLSTSLKIYRKFNHYSKALQLALQLNDLDLIRDIFLSAKENALLMKQLAFQLGRQQVYLDLEGEDIEDQDDLVEIMANAHLNANFLALGRELDIMEPKKPEDIYKTHLENARHSSNVDSASQNLASSFVNGLINAGFVRDKLLTTDEGNKWIYKNKTYGMLSATASLGLILLWDVESGLTEIDKYLYSPEDYIKAGALLACGIVNCGVRNECDPALALLSDYVLNQSNVMRIGAIVGLGLAYAGSQREDVMEIISPALWDSNSSLEVMCQAALSCGLVAVGSCHGELTESLLQAIMEHADKHTNETHLRHLALGLALLYLGKQDAVEATMAALQVVDNPVGQWARTLLQICAYAGTGDVLKIQSLLHICSEHYSTSDAEEKSESTTATTNTSSNSTTTNAAAGSSGGATSGAASAGGEDQTADGTSGKKKKAKPKAEPGSLTEPGSHQGLATLGIALLAMGEGIGMDMCLRMYNHLLQYGEPVIRRAVPLALALLSMSHPQLTVIDTLSKLSHDSDSDVVHNAILAMGLVGSGTNNARLAGMLRQLAQYYHKDPPSLFMVRLAQGLTHLGKGTLTLNPFHSDCSLLSHVALGGIISLLVSCMDSSKTLLGDSHYLFYWLVPAIQPRMLVTLDESLSSIGVNVRVGQAVDIVGQVGKPRSITGFQTHTTPVLLAHGERAELATDEYTPLTPIIEGFVILKKNPEEAKS